MVLIDPDGVLARTRYQGPEHRRAVTAIRTIGHGTLGAEQFAELARGAGVETVVDVRRYPGSRRHPHFARDAMAVWLPANGMAYRWLAVLGGRRKPSPDSANAGWRNPQFRAYADYMASEEFAAGVSELKELAAGCSVAVMCSESVWWRCHRRLLADHLVVVERIPVDHVFHDGRLTSHEPISGARRNGSHLIYPAADLESAPPPGAATSVGGQ
jgi:uncharacterized protein (DUF488 family)